MSECGGPVLDNVRPRPPRVDAVRDCDKRGRTSHKSPGHPPAQLTCHVNSTIVEVVVIINLQHPSSESDLRPVSKQDNETFHSKLNVIPMR